MSIHDNKQLVSQFFERFNSGDVSGVLELLADDATWRVPGKPGTVPIAGERTKRQMARVFSGMLDGLKNGVRFTVTGLTAEEDRVAVELESYGELRNGRIYNNEYHLLMRISEGKIRVAHEYYDTQHTLETWFKS